MKKNTEVSTHVSEEALALLRESYPVEQSVNRILLPRIGLVSQDKTEGKGKAMKVVQEAGTFYIERQTDEINEEGKKVWAKEDIGTSFEGIILFQRKQLRFYDSATESYTSSPIYDNDDEIVPLFKDKQEVDRAKPSELKARKEYKGVSAKGKAISKLEENRILYVLKDGEVFQLNLRGTSMFAFMAYAKKVLPPSVLTSFGSEPKENGSIAWSQMTFRAMRHLDESEVTDIHAKIVDIKDAIVREKAQYVTDDSGDKDMQNLAAGK